MPLYTFAEYVLMTPDALEALRDAYMADVTLGGTWGAEVEARHLAQIFGVTVVFWTESDTHTFQEVHRYGNGRQTLHVLNTAAHFEALKSSPTEGAPFSRTGVATNSGGGDCLYRAFHQALRRSDEEPSMTALSIYRELVAGSMRREPELDLEGLLVTLLDDFAEWGFALGAGPLLQRAILRLYAQYARSDRPGGGSIPPFGRKQRDDLVLGMRDFVPRGELSRADRLLDRIGRLIATAASVHVAVALDGNAIVMSPNTDTVTVMTALDKLIRRYGRSEGIDDDPMAGVHEGTLRVKRTTTFGGTVKTRRSMDINKLKALESGDLEELSSGITLDKLRRIKAALAAGVLVDGGGATAKQKYLRGDVGVYLIPHVVPVPLSGHGVVHGEMNVTDAIQERRHQEFLRGNILRDDVFVGGTLIDCFDCNKTHKSRNEKLRQLGHRWRFYSGGTHGNSFPNWYLDQGIQANIDTPTFDTERFPGGRSVPFWDRRGRSGQYGYDNYVRVRYYYYYDRGGSKRWTNYTTDRWGNPNHYEDRDENHIIWQAMPRTFLIDLFHRHRDDSHIDNGHSSFADDSDSDTDEYPDLIVQKRDRVRRRKGSLLDSYSKGRDVKLCDLFTGAPYFTLPFTMSSAQERPLLSSAMWMYSRLFMQPIAIKPMRHETSLSLKSTLGGHSLVPSTKPLSLGKVMALSKSTGASLGPFGRSPERVGSPKAVGTMSIAKVMAPSKVTGAMPRPLERMGSPPTGGRMTFQSTSNVIVPYTGGGAAGASRSMAMVFFTGEGTHASGASTFIPDEDLYDILRGFSQDRLGELFEAAVRVEIPSRRGGTHNAIAQIEDVGARYQVAVRPMADLLDALRDVWMVASASNESLLGEDGPPAFNLGSICSLFVLVMSTLGGQYVIDPDVPLLHIWDGIWQATLLAYNERRIDDPAFVVQGRILVYLFTALRMTPLGQWSLNDVLNIARRNAN